jgi:hypothetical protein
LISPSKSLWSNNVLTVPVSQYDGACVTSCILFKNFFSYIIKFFQFVIFLLSVGMYICINKVHTISAFKSSDPVITHILVNSTSHYAFMYQYRYLSFSSFTSGRIDIQSTSLLHISPLPFHHTSLTHRTDTAFFCVSFFRFSSFPP